MMRVPWSPMICSLKSKWALHITPLQIIFLPARIFVNGMHVVADLAPVFPIIDAARGDHGNGLRADGPVGDINLVRGQFRHHPAGVFLVHAPIERRSNLGSGTGRRQLLLRSHWARTVMTLPSAPLRIISMATW